ncbi:hypothetical protein D3C71_2022110 [compost metagenome]
MLNPLSSFCPVEDMFVGSFAAARGEDVKVIFTLPLIGARDQLPSAVGSIVLASVM